MTADLALAIDDCSSPARRAAWLTLVQDIFSIDLSEYSGYGVWHPGYRAFSWLAGDRIAANVSIRPLRLMVAGRPVPAAQLHAVATRPEYRRRGLFRDLMARVLAFADGRFDRLLLYTATSDLYPPFGFRHLPMHRFIGRLPAAEGKPARTRSLSVDDPADRALMLRLHDGREPVSSRFGLGANGDVLVANATLRRHWRLDYLEREDALVVWEISHGRTRLLDIVAPRMPSAAAIASLSGLGGGPIEVHFPPDRLGGDFRAIPDVPEDGDFLWIRGPLEVEGEPVMLSPASVS
jgi:GNAT superfamily N-acetyltransferase